MKTIRSLALVAAAGALAAAPAVADAHHRTGHTNGPNGKNCKTLKLGFVVKGTVTATSADGTSFTIDVTKANRHARRALDGSTSFSPAGGDTFTVRFSHYESGETPAAGDVVRAIGKVAYTKKRCAPPGTSLNDRYGAVNLRRVRFFDKTD